MSTSCADGDAGRRVVIVGGGYAGTTCAVSLARSLRRGGEPNVLLVEPNPCQQALSELDLVAVGPTQPQFCELWHPTVFEGLPVTVCYDHVTDVRPNDHTVVVGEGGEPIGYWRLVLATGAVPHFPPIPGLHDNAVTMWSVEDAQELQSRVDETFHEALKVADREERRRVLSFVVIGGGATGIEIVGTLAAMLPKRARTYGLDPKDLCVRLVEGRPDILYDLPEELRGAALRRLRRLRVETVCGDKLSAVEPGEVVLNTGRRLPASVVVWCGGAKADPHAAEWGLEAASDGRVVADECLKAPGFDDIYVIGDLACVREPGTKRILPMLAQVAIQEGPHVAESILAESRGAAALRFTPHLRGEFVSIGPTWGVGWMYGLHLRGIPAIVMKRITYVKYWLQVGGVGLAWRRTREMLAMQR